MLVVDDNEFRFEVIPVNGDKLQARYDHCTSALEEKGVMFIYGGRNAAHEFISELCIFNFETLSWKKCALKGEPNHQTSSFSMNPYQNQLILYGGIN